MRGRDGDPTALGSRMKLLWLDNLVLDMGRRAGTCARACTIFTHNDGEDRAGSRGGELSEFRGWGGAVGECREKAALTWTKIGKERANSKEWN